MQQKSKFIRVCKSIVTSSSDMEQWVCEVNHVSQFRYTWVNLCDCNSWILPWVPSIHGELLPLDTARMEFYKNMFKYGDIPISFGVVNPWSKLLVLYGLIILCDCITWTLVNIRILRDTPRIGIYYYEIINCDIHNRLELQAHVINHVSWFCYIWIGNSVLGI